MQLTLINVLIFIGLAGLGIIVGASVSVLAHLPHHISEWLKWLCAGMAVLMLASPVHRHFRYRPLCMPRCPHCHKRPDCYFIVEGEWPRLLLTCGQCQQSCEVWLRRGVHPVNITGAVPTFCLRWPEFVGWWQRISPP